MTKTLSIAVALALSSLCGGCAGVDVLLPHDVYGGAREVESLTLAVGEEVGVVRQRFGIVPMPGGYGWGLAAEDPEVVQVRYTEESRSTLASLVGRSPGTSYVFYVNRYVYPDPELPIEDDGQTLDELRRDHVHFKVHVRPE